MQRELTTFDFGVGRAWLVAAADRAGTHVKGSVLGIDKLRLE